MDSGYKIQAEHVSKVFKLYAASMDRLKEAFSLTGRERHTDFYAVSDLSFSVKRGEIMGVMGKNGSGKSTLLKMIAGIYGPTQGSISVHGKISSLLELGMGFNMEYTGIENIFFYGALMDLTKAQVKERLPDIVGFAEIGDYVYQPVKTYSSGMFARLAFSCAVNVEPDILIVDEILSVGDMRFQAKCFRKFKEFKDKGATILYVGHDVGVMRTFCDTAMWLHQGRLMDLGDPTLVSAEYTEFMHAKDGPKLMGPRCLSGDARKGAGFAGSIAHWGTHTGMVGSVTVCGESGGSQEVFHADERLRIEAAFDVGSEIDTEYLSLAFSIKNTEGTDILVKTTFDENIRLQGGNGQKVAFEFVSGLADGDYYLVLALENRKNTPVTYYEYIEGACYFKMYTPRKIFGIYDVNASIVYDAGNEDGKGGADEDDEYQSKRILGPQI